MRVRSLEGGALLYLHRYYLPYKCKFYFCGFSKIHNILFILSMTNTICCVIVDGTQKCVQKHGGNFSANLYVLVR